MRLARTRDPSGIGRGPGPPGPPPGGSGAVSRPCLGLPDGLLHQTVQLVGRVRQPVGNRLRSLREPKVAPHAAPSRLLPAVALEVVREVHVEEGDAIGIPEEVRARIPARLVEADEAVDLPGQRLVLNTAVPSENAILRQSSGSTLVLMME